MHIRILGSAAGGGFPQWNCNCRNCHGVRTGDLRARARTQSSIAISDDGQQWILCNASPDIRAQLAAFPAAQPARRVRDTAIAAIVLLDSQIDHTSGLLSLREGCPHAVWCTPAVHEDLCEGFPLFNILAFWNGGLQWNPIDPGRDFTIPACPGLRFTPIPLLSDAPPYSPHRHDPPPGATIGLIVRDTRSGGCLFHAPGIGRVDEAVRAAMSGADCLLVDGTLWHDDELRSSGVGSASGRDMGHLALSGHGGMLEVLDGLTVPRKILTHINNTNPILDEDSPEHAELHRHGVELAWDGMDIHL